MTATLRKLYARFRKAGTGMVGQDARAALWQARILEQWQRLSTAGLVRIDLQEEINPDLSYLDTWEHLSEKSKQRIIESIYDKGIYGVVGQYQTADSPEWKTADSVWNCQGYRNAADPFENEYVIQIMASTIEALKHSLQARYCNHCGHRQTA